MATTKKVTSIKNDLTDNEVNEEMKPIIIHDNEHEKDYTLEFNRDSVRFAEANGFKIEEALEYPALKVPDLFFYAFRAHHMNMSREKTDRILFDDLGGISKKLSSRLMDMYAATYLSLYNETGEPKNPNVTVDF
jgi:hypothetical protein